MFVGSPYDKTYSSEDYYWGTKPSRLSHRIVEMAKPTADPQPTLLDLGCGEGRDAVWMALHGFAVTGLDLSVVGLTKMLAYAGQVGASVRTIVADFATYQFDRAYDVIMSVGALHYLPVPLRQATVERCKHFTVPGGLNAFSVFVEKPFVQPAPDPQGGGQLYSSGQLVGYYCDWEILWRDERIVQCRSGGVAHQHAIAEVIARKP